MIAFQYKDQIEAHEFLMEVEPGNADEKRILENAYKESPDDYRMVKYDYVEQLKQKESRKSAVTKLDNKES